MEFLSQNKMLVIGLVVLVAGCVVWFGVLGSGGNAPALLTTERVADANVATDADLVAALKRLHAVTLSGSIFSDPLFASLHDFSTQIVPEAIGRDNPFAPLTVVSPATTTLSPKLFSPSRKKY